MSDQDELELHPLPRRILVPVDDNPSTGAALRRAAALASALGAELLLLGVNPVTLPSYEMPSGTALALDAAQQEAEQDLAETLTRERVLEAQERLPSGVRSRAVFGWAPAGASIVRTAQEERADLIVVPMHDGGALSHLLRDGTDRHVLHRSDVPVLVVPEA